MLLLIQDKEERKFKMIKDIYKVMEFDTGYHDGIVVDLDRKQFVRIETEKRQAEVLCIYGMELKKTL